MASKNKLLSFLFLKIEDFLLLGFLTPSQPNWISTTVVVF